MSRRLAQVSRARIATARAELRDQRAALDALSQRSGLAAPRPPFGPNLERTLFELVQEQ